MKKLITKLKINPVTLTVLLAIVFFFGNSLKPTVAQVAGGGTVPYPFQDATVDANNINNLCEPAMKSFADKDLADFRKFVETNFQNKSSTASLTDFALGKYRELRAELNTAINKYHPNFASLQMTTAIQPNKCRQIIDQTLADARILLKRNAVRTSGVKKTTALLEKYQQINAQLGNLFQQFVYVKGYLDSFSSKLPCYPKTGCVKG